MKYRPEIDGLRALAVLPVIFFHAGFKLFEAGFVGVDIFFVISGYLITTILIEDLDNERFSIINFYQRRARRILPALYFVILIVSIISTFLMNPQQLKDYGQSIISSVFFISNIYFYFKADYWSQSSEFLPLLHTWSLAVEEQFYLLFPIFLFIVWRFAKSKIFWILLIIAMMSLLLSELIWRQNSSANFYLTLTRIWELFIGSLLALIVKKKGVQSNNFFSILGLTFIFISIFFYEKSTPSPSLYTMLPVLGVFFFILYADKNTLAARLLSTKILVGLGLISYSAYLWHQPLFALTRIYISDINLNVFLKFFLILITFILAYLSYKLIEVRFRNKNIVSSRNILFISIIPFFVFAFYGYFLHKSNGIKNFKLSLVSNQTALLLKILEEERLERINMWKKELLDANLKFEKNNKLNLLFLGDSISEDLYLVSKQSKSISDKFNFRQLSFDGECGKHLKTNGNEKNHNDELCSQSIENYNELDLLKNTDVIILALAWLSNSKYISDVMKLDFISNKKIILYQSHSFSDISSLIYTLNAKKYSYKSDNAKSFFYLNKRNRTLISNAIIKNYAIKNNFNYINSFDAFCDETKKKMLII